MNSKRLIKRIAGYTASTALLLSGVSAYALHELEKINAREFAHSEVIIRGRKIPLQEFYEHIESRNGKWIYKERKEDYVLICDIKDRSDFNVRNVAMSFKNREKQKRYVKIDTVYYMQADDGKWVYSLKKMDKQGRFDTIQNSPSRGINLQNGMVIRQFEPMNGKRDMKIEQHNDKYNCTSEHEDQHYRNNQLGRDIKNPANIGQIGQSYELTFVETCLDEISANIRQLKAQRRNYLKNNKDTVYITSQYKFYAEALRDGRINPKSPDKISKEERLFIANGIFDYWMKERYPIYKEYNTKRAIRIHNTMNSNYNSVLEDKIRHRRVVKHIFLIEGLDFSEVILKREHEILERITPEQKALFAEETAKKKVASEENHFDELEYIRMTEGEQAFSEKIEQNIKLAKINKQVASIKKYFGLSR